MDLYPIPPYHWENKTPDPSLAYDCGSVMEASLLESEESFLVNAVNKGSICCFIRIKIIAALLLFVWLFEFCFTAFHGGYAAYLEFTIALVWNNFTLDFYPSVAFLVVKGICLAMFALSIITSYALCNVPLLLYTIVFATLEIIVGTMYLVQMASGTIAHPEWREAVYQFLFPDQKEKHSDYKLALFVVTVQYFSVCLHCISGVIIVKLARWQNAYCAYKSFRDSIDV